LLIGIALGKGKNPAQTSSCFSGHLIIEGSTAFAPTAADIRRTYLSLCDQSRITVRATGTYNGLDDLMNTGGRRGVATSTVAMSDGVVSHAQYPALQSTPLGVIVFSVVVSKDAHVPELTLTQIRDIYQRKYTNWKQVGGADLPITFVERDENSGTKHTFDTTILGGASEPSPSAVNCPITTVVSAGAVACTASTTTALLQDVNASTGAIGYAQTTQASGGNYPKIQSIRINKAAPGITSVEAGSYPFWAVESLYTFGNPGPSSPAAGFRDYLTGSAAPDIARSQGYTPCADLPQNLRTRACQ
jgi:ABC-type phosphate transport system substrate-binding protein